MKTFRWPAATSALALLALPVAAQEARDRRQERLPDAILWPDTQPETGSEVEFNSDAYSIFRTGPSVTPRNGFEIDPGSLFSLYHAVVDSEQEMTLPHPHAHPWDAGKPSFLSQLQCPGCRASLAGRQEATEAADEPRCFHMIESPDEIRALEGMGKGTAPPPSFRYGKPDVDPLPDAPWSQRTGLGALFSDPQHLNDARQDGGPRSYDLDGDGVIDTYESDTTTRLGPLELRVKGRGDSAGFNPLEDVLPIRPRN